MEAKRKSKEDAAAAEMEENVLSRLAPHLEAADPARTMGLSEEESGAIEHLNLLTMKPMIYAANINEDDLANGGADNKHVQVGLWFSEICLLIVMS